MTAKERSILQARLDQLQAELRNKITAMPVRRLHNLLLLAEAQHDMGPTTDERFLGLAAALSVLQMILSDIEETDCEGK